MTSKKVVQKMQTQFFLNKDEYLEIRTDDQLPMKQVYNCYHIEIWFVGKEGAIRFGWDSSHQFCYGLQLMIGLALQGKLVVRETKENLGISLNNFFYNLPDSVPWEKYHLFSNSHQGIRPYYSSWLYNDSDGNIIFEITPSYLWNDEDKKERKKPDFIEYAEFMKNYKPIVMRVVDKKYLQAWIEPLKELEALFQKNEDAENERMEKDEDEHVNG